MLLSTGQKAPNFITTDITGTPIKLADYEGKKLLICFLRYAGCPFCNLLLHSLIERYPTLHKHGLEVLVFIQSPKESIVAYPPIKQQPSPPFPLLADPDCTIYKLYGVDSSFARFTRGLITAPKLFRQLYKHHLPQGKIDGKLFLIPAFFLIGPDDLTIHKAYYSPDFSTMIPDVDIMNFLSD